MFKIWQDVALEVNKNWNKDIRILTEIPVNHGQIHHIKNNWFGPIFLSPGDSHAKGLLALIYLDIEGVPKINTDPNRKVGLH